MSSNFAEISSGAASTATPRAALSLNSTVAIVCIAAALVARAAIFSGRPLWLDEIWTGAIVAQPDTPHLLHEIYLDPNAPLYFGVMYGWTKLFGLSDAALRFPSLVFGAAVPLLIAFARVPGLSRNARLAWAALLALWVPGIWFSQEARCYALLLLVCSAQSVLFLRLMATPWLRTACWWAGCSSLAVLTHYHAGLLTLCEGIAFLAVWRMRALKTWPAALAFVPAFAWIAWHSPRLADIAQSGAAWYGILQPADLLYTLQFLAGVPAVPLAFALAAGVAYSFGVKPLPLGHTGSKSAKLGCRMLILCALAAACILITVGFMRPAFTSRYLMPVVPAFALALALAVQTLARRWAPAYALVLLVSFGGGILALRDIAQRPRVYSFEQASHDLAGDGVREVLFAFDNPATPVLHDSTLRALGGFYFQRDSIPAAVTPFRLRAGEDASAALLAHAQSPHTGLLWVYDLKMRNTAATLVLPHIAELDGRWRCHNYGKDNIGVIACVNTEWLAETAAAQ